ncbi:MAG: hypothetical protein HYY00_05260 [Chloroflexi bacterium]|nr:hypothetical protein [Chloroflexota bacterium]
MGLDIGIIHIQYLARPHGWAYKFVWELAIEASGSGYMHGDGNNWGPFTQRHVLQMLDEFAGDKGLDATAKAEVLAWVRSLPWEGWRDDLDISAAQDDDHDPWVDGPNEQDGGLIELHFNW